MKIEDLIPIWWHHIMDILVPVLALAGAAWSYIGNELDAASQSVTVMLMLVAWYLGMKLQSIHEAIRKQTDTLHQSLILLRERR